MTKSIKELGFQGDIAFIRVDGHIRKAFKAIYNMDIDDIIKDKANRIMGALQGDGVLAAGLHPEKGLVLAQGESRSHYHAFRNPDAVELYAVNDNVRLLLIKDAEPLVHEEHDGILFDPSVFNQPENEPVIYIQGGQFEYDYSDEYRRVAD